MKGFEPGFYLYFFSVAFYLQVGRGTWGVLVMLHLAFITKFIWCKLFDGAFADIFIILRMPVSPILMEAPTHWLSFTILQPLWVHGYVVSTPALHSYYWTMRRSFECGRCGIFCPMSFHWASSLFFYPCLLKDPLSGKKWVIRKSRREEYFKLFHKQKPKQQ